MSKYDIKTPAQTPPTKPGLIVQPPLVQPPLVQPDETSFIAKDIAKDSAQDSMKAALENYVAETFTVPGGTVTSPQKMPASSDVPPVGTLSGVGVRPTHNWVVIRPIEKEEATASGIAFPQTASRKSNEGIVVALGPGRREFRPDIAERNNLLVTAYNDALASYKERLARVNSVASKGGILDGPPEFPELANPYDYIPIDLKVGDRVLYIRWAGYAVEVNGEKHYAVEEQNVPLVAEDPDVDLQFWSEKH
jgi:co-chaperonin GroES (HSP10)